MTEFYRNGPYGLEQGFTVVRPQSSSGAVVLALDTSGSFRTAQVGSEILFRTLSGSTALRYGDLRAVDADGRELPVQLHLRGNAISLLVDARNARYPLAIDPLISFPGGALTGSGGAAKAGFGYAVSISADGTTALIGAPGQEGESGAAGSSRERSRLE